MTRWTRTLLAATAGLLVGTAACSSAPAPAASVPAPAASGPAPAAAPDAHSGHGGGEPGAVELWAVQTGVLGVVVTDNEGRLLYRSDRDRNAPPTSTCTGDCMSTWEPLLATGPAPELLGVDEDVLGTLQRVDGGTQYTLGGWPIYRRAGEPGGLQDAGSSGAEGVWFAVTPDGGKAAAT